MADTMDAETNGHKRIKATCALVLLLGAGAAAAQNPPATEPPAQTATASAPATAQKTPAAPPKISYVGGQLKINALDSTLTDVLTKVAVVTGVTIDIPPGVKSERMPVVELGPGPAREILASLLSGSNFDYLIQASDADPEKIQSVLLISRTKKGSGTKEINAAARPSRSPYSRAGAPPAASEEAPAESVVAEAISVNPQSGSTQPDQSSPSPTPQPDQPTQPTLLQPEQSNVPKTAPQALPTTMSSQAFNQQLQQMYQQRAQMIQQERQTGAPAGTTPAH